MQSQEFAANSFDCSHDKVLEQVIFNNAEVFEPRPERTKYGIYLRRT